jgi:hypothetical protein
MRPSRYHIALTLLAIVAFAPCHLPVVAQEIAAAAPAPLNDGDRGVLMLQDGGVLDGQITRAADWYVVIRPGGSQMQIAASRVQFAGRSLHDAYLHRRQNTSLTTTGAHLGLAEWCLRYSLVSDAEAELEAARKMGGNEIRLGLAERRLEAIKNRQVQKPSAVQQASATLPAPEKAVEQPAPPRITSRDLPDGVLELFTRRVQPVLVNNCTASKCHQPGGNQEFQLNRAMLRGEANRRTTTQNLTATLALVDRDHPELSPLLTVPRRTHGGMNRPIFGARHDQAFKHLADWVALVAPTKAAEESAPAVETIAGAKPNARNGNTARGPAANLQATARDRGVVSQLGTDDGELADSDAMQPAVAAEDAQPETLRSPRKLQYGVTGEKWQPRDAFDPEIFNRRQRANSPR